MLPLSNIRLLFISLIGAFALFTLYPACAADEKISNAADSIMDQIFTCWNVPAEAKDAKNIDVIILADLNRDGSYKKIEFSEESKKRYESDTLFKAVADSATKAIENCAPLKGLPSDHYEEWKELELHFDPKYMLQ